jgi:hypothetical protein
MLQCYPKFFIKLKKVRILIRGAPVRLEAKKQA